MAWVIRMTKSVRPDEYDYISLRPKPDPTTLMHRLFKSIYKKRLAEHLINLDNYREYVRTTYGMIPEDFTFAYCKYQSQVVTESFEDKDVALHLLHTHFAQQDATMEFYSFPTNTEWEWDINITLFIKTTYSLEEV